jgi:uncharacterized repeat protein (TIGR02543 family)
LPRRPLRSPRLQHGTLTVTDAAGSSIASGASVTPGSKITVTATPDSGYNLSTLTVNGTPVSSGASCTVAGDTVIAASFTAQSVPGGGVSGGGVSGGGTAASAYTLTFNTSGGSAIAAISQTAGTSIDLSGYTPVRDGYTFAGWYSDKSLTTAVASVKLTADTTIYAKWTQKAELPFTDIPDGAYYKDAVGWAVEQKITEGITPTTFDPDGGCTRGQAVTFLWRAAGSPAPKTDVMPFTDVPADSDYYNAVLWAVEQGVVKGTSETTFSSDMECTRAQIVTFLWRGNGSETAKTANPFADVKDDAYYENAVVWAVGKKITEGIRNRYLRAQGCVQPCTDCHVPLPSPEKIKAKHVCPGGFAGAHVLFMRFVCHGSPDFRAVPPACRRRGLQWERELHEINILQHFLLKLKLNIIQLFHVSNCQQSFTLWLGNGNVQVG